MNLFDQISNDIKTAMLAKDRVKLDALRGIKKEFIEAKTAKGAEGELTDENATRILQKMVKQRKESAEIFNTQNRPELAEKELIEAGVIEAYLPQQMSVEEIEEAIRTIIVEVGATSIKEMGKVMGAATKKLAGLADGKVISETVKRLLA